MADLNVVALDSSTADRIRYAVGASNWSSPDEDGQGWVPDLAGAGTVRLGADQRIDVLLLGDGFEAEPDFRAKVESWVAAFFAVEVYERFRGAFRIRALFTRSGGPATSDGGSYYGVGINGDGDILRDPRWWEGDDDRAVGFRERLWGSMGAFEDINLATYPSDLTESEVIHNTLAGLYSNLVVVMLVRRARPDGSISVSPTGMTRRVNRTTGDPLGVNLALGENSLHEFGHAFAYLEDEYIAERGSVAVRENPAVPSVFNLSNLSFDTQLDRVPWAHLSPWGRTERQGNEASSAPVVGWLWRGGEDDLEVWHSEYQCLMNGKHVNYAYTPDAFRDPTANPPTDCPRFVDGGSDLRWRDPPTYCLWCQEIVVIHILEKTGQLTGPGDDPSIDVRGVAWYLRWQGEGRDRYWAFFDVPEQLRQREAWYADPSLRPGDLCQLMSADGSYLVLGRSPLYRVFSAGPTSGGSPPEMDDGEELLVATA